MNMVFTCFKLFSSFIVNIQNAKLKAIQPIYQRLYY